MGTHILLATILFLSLSTPLYSSKQTIPGDYTKSILDKFALMQGDTEFDSETWSYLKTCMTSDSLAGDLLTLSDKGWSGFIQYGQNSGSSNDHWGVNFIWFEHNVTTLPTLTPGLKIDEPCGATSNIAYMRTLLSLCHHENWSIPVKFVSALKQTFALETIGSTFLHSSGTSLGGGMDCTSENMFTWVMHQSSLNYFPYDPVLLDFSETPHVRNSVEQVNDMVQMVLTQNVFSWHDLVNKMDVPEIRTSMSALFVTGFSLPLPEPAVYGILDIFGSAGILQPKDVDFFRNIYIPRILETFKNQSVFPGIQTEVEFLFRIVGTSVKLLYGVLWQEQLIKNTFFQESTVTSLGSYLMPLVNSWGNSLSGYHSNDMTIDAAQQNCINVYPGRNNCPGHNFSHFLWHEETAASLMDLSFVADDIYRIISHQPLERQRNFSDKCVNNISEIYSILGSGGFDFFSIVSYFFDTDRIPRNPAVVPNIEKFLEVVELCVL